MKTITFKFDVDQIVMTPLGTKGIITCAFLDNTNIIQYFVTYDNGNGSYWREDQLLEIL
jgi:hypothetical protein